MLYIKRVYVSSNEATDFVKESFIKSVDEAKSNYETVPHIKEEVIKS